jgi:hypothetical protein
MNPDALLTHIVGMKAIDFKIIYVTLFYLVVTKKGTDLFFEKAVNR